MGIDDINVNDTYVRILDLLESSREFLIDSDDDESGISMVNRKLDTALDLICSLMYSDPRREIITTGFSRGGL